MENRMKKLEEMRKIINQILQLNARMPEILSAEETARMLSILFNRYMDILDEVAANAEKGDGKRGRKT